MTDDDRRGRKPDFRTAAADIKAIATVLGRRLNFRSPAVLVAIGVIATLVLAVAVVMVLLRTGGSKALADNAGLIGALVALGGVFTAQMVGISLDDRRAQQARELEAQRAGEAALQNYLIDVGELLIEKPLREASPGDNLSTVVRAQTLAVLEGLDPDRKRILLSFLYESGLIYKDKQVVSLMGANLIDANLKEVHLEKANLYVATLNGADLSEASLSGATLFGASLNGAELRRSILLGANLFGAKLNGADLSEANLSGASLWNASLSEAILSGTILTQANLFGANLRGAHGWTEDQLSEAVSLKGAAMPDGVALQGFNIPVGPTFEDWLKDRERRKEDEKNE